MNKVDLIKCAINDELPYRKILNVYEPFGLEVEAGLYNPSDKFYICNEYLEKKGYVRGVDRTVGGNFPLEIRTPVLFDEVDTWNDLFAMSKRMKECPIDFTNSAFQVNIDVDYDNVLCYYLVLFFRTFEHIIFKFSTSGCDRLRLLGYSASLHNFFLLFNERDLENELFFWLSENHRYAISFKFRKDTPVGAPPNIVEFRIANGCDDAWLWQNYVNTFYYLATAIPKIDLNYIDYSLCYGEIKEKNYLDLHLEDALFFADILFKEDIDKIYFLKQYIGKDIDKANEYVRKIRL